MNSKKKYFYNYSKVTHLLLVKLNDFYKRKRQIKISNHQKSELIDKLILFLGDSLKGLAAPIIEVDLLQSKRKIWEKFDDINSDFHTNPEIQSLMKVVEEFENQTISYRDFSRTCNSIIYLTRSMIFSHKQAMKGKDEVSISFLRSVCEERLIYIKKAKEICDSNQSRFNANADVLLREAGNLLDETIEYLEKSLEHCDLAIRVQQELFSDDFFEEPSDSSDGSNRLDMMAKLFDSKYTIEETLSELLLIQYQKEVSSLAISEKLKNEKLSFPSVPKELLERFFQIKCKNDYIARLAPRDIIAETAIMCEKVFYVDLYLPASKIIDNFKSYARKIKLDFRGDNSLTIGFFLYWLDTDPDFIKRIIPESASVSSLIEDSLKINKIRNRSLHKKKDKDIIVTAEDSTNCVSAMGSIIRELYQ